MFTILSLVVLVIGIISSCNTSSQRPSTSTPIPKQQPTQEVTKTAVIETPTAETVSPREIRITPDGINFWILNNIPNEETGELNFLTRAFKKVFEILEYPAKIFPCEELHIVTKNDLDELGARIDKFPYDQQGELCIKLGVFGNDFFRGNSGSGYYIAVVGVDPISAVGLSECLKSPYCGFWQPALLEADLPRELWDGVDSVSEWDTLAMSVIRYLILSDPNYACLLVNIAPISKEKFEQLKVYINTNNSIPLEPPDK